METTLHRKRCVSIRVRKHEGTAEKARPPPEPPWARKRALSCSATQAKCSPLCGVVPLGSSPRGSILTVARQVQTTGSQSGGRASCSNASHSAPRNLGPHPNGGQLVQLPTTSHNQHVDRAYCGQPQTCVHCGARDHPTTNNGRDTMSLITPTAQSLGTSNKEQRQRHAANSTAHSHCKSGMVGILSKNV